MLSNAYVNNNFLISSGNEETAFTDEVKLKATEMKTCTIGTRKQTSSIAVQGFQRRKTAKLL